MTNKRRYTLIENANGRTSFISEDDLQKNIDNYKNTHRGIRAINPESNNEEWLDITQYDDFVKAGNQLAWYDGDIPASVPDTTEKVSALDSIPTQKVDSVPTPSVNPQRSGNTFTPLFEKTESKQTPQFDGSTFSNQLGIYDNNEADVPLSSLKEKEERDEGVKDYADKVEKHMSGMVTAEEAPIFTSGLSEKQDVDLGFDFSNVTPEDIFRTSDAQFERINKRPPTMRESIDAYENNVKQIGQYYQRKASEEAKDVSNEIKSLEEEIALYDKSLSIDGFLMPQQQAKLNESKLRLEKLKEEKDRINEKYLGSPLYKDYLKKEENIAKSDANRYRRELASESANSTTIRTPFAPAYIAYENPEKVRNLNSAVEMAEQRARIYGAPSRYDEKTGKIFTDFASAVVDVMSSKDFWTLGFTEIARNFDIRGIQEKLATANKALIEAEKRGIEDVELKDFGVSDEDMAALTEFFKLSDAVAARQEDTSKSYRAGQGFAENIPFMVEFAITGGITSGISKGVSVGLKKALTNAFKKSLGLVDDKIVSVTGKKVAANVLNNATEAIGKSIAGIPATLISPSTYNNLSQKLTEVDMSGNLVYKNGWDAVVPALADSYIERLSEAGVGNIASGSVGIAAKSLFKRLPKTKISNMTDFLSGSTFGKIAKATGFHGMLGEIEEEFFGNGLRLMTGLMDKEEFKDFASWDNMLVMAGSFLPMTLMGAASNSASLLNANSKRKSYRNDAISILENAGVKREDAKKFFSDTDIDNEDISSIAKRLKGLLKDSNAFLDSESGQKLVADITNYLKYDVVFNMTDSDKRKLILDSEAPLVRWRNSRGVNTDIEVVDFVTERKNIDFHFDDVMPERDRESLSETIFKVAENGGSLAGDTFVYTLQKNDNNSYTLELQYVDSTGETQTKNYNFTIKPSREAEVERTIKSISGSRPKSKAPVLQRTNTPQQVPTSTPASESTPTPQQAPAPVPTPAQQDAAAGNVTAEDVAERNSNANVDDNGNLTLISGRVNVDGRDIDFTEAVVVNETSGTYSVKLDSGDIVTVSKNSISPDAIKVVNKQEYEAKIADVESQAAEQAQQDVEVITGGEQQPQPQQVRVDYSDEEFASDEARAVIDDISSRVYDENGDMLEEEYAKLSPEEKYLLERDIYDTKEEADNAIAEKIAEAQKKLQNARKGGAKNKKKVLEAQRELKEYQDMANAAGIAIQEDVKVITPEQPQSGDGEKQVTKGTAQTAQTAQTQQEEGEESEVGDVGSDVKGVEDTEEIEDTEDTEDTEVIVEEIDIDADDNAAIKTLKNKGAGLGSRVLALAKIARTFGFGSQDKEKLSVKPTKSDVDKDKAGKAYNRVWKQLSRNKILDKQDLNYVITKLQKIDELQEYLELMNEQVRGIDIDAEIDASKKFRNIMKAFISERKMLGNKTVVAAEGAVATPKEADADDVRTGDIKTHIKELPTISILSRMKAIYNKISIFEKYNDMEQEEKRLYDIAKLINAAYVDMIPPKDFAKSEDIQGQLDNAYATYMRYVNIANGLTPVEVENDTKWYDSNGEEVNLEKFYSINNSGNLKVLPKGKPELSKENPYAAYSNFYSSVKEQSLEYEGYSLDEYYKRQNKSDKEKDSDTAKTMTSREAGALGRLFNAYMNELTNRVQYEDFTEGQKAVLNKQVEEIKELEKDIADLKDKKAELQKKGEDVEGITNEIKKKGEELARKKREKPVGKNDIKTISSKWFQNALNLKLPSEQEMQNIIDALELDGDGRVQRDGENILFKDGFGLVDEGKNQQKRKNKEQGFGAVSNESVKFVIEHYMKFKELIDLRDVQSKSKELTLEQVEKGKGNYTRLGQSNVPDYAKEDIKEYRFPTPVEFSVPGVNILESAEQYTNRVTKDIEEKIERLKRLNDTVSRDNVSEEIKASTEQAIDASITELEEYKKAISDWYDAINRIEGGQENLITIFQKRKEKPKGKLSAEALRGRVKSLIDAGIEISDIVNVLTPQITNRNEFDLLMEALDVKKDIANEMWKEHIAYTAYKRPFNEQLLKTFSKELYFDIADSWKSVVNAITGVSSKNFNKRINAPRKASLFEKWDGFENLKGIDKDGDIYIDNIKSETKYSDGKYITTVSVRPRVINEDGSIGDTIGELSYTIEMDYSDKSKGKASKSKTSKSGSKKPKSKREKRQGKLDDVTVEGKTAVEQVSLEFTKKDIEGTPLKVQGKYQSLEAAVQAQKLAYLSTDMSKEEKEEILKELKRTKDDKKAEKIGEKIKVKDEWKEDEAKIREWLEEYNKKQPNSIDLTDALKRSAKNDDNDNDDGGDDGGGTPPPTSPTKGRGTSKSKGGSTAKSASKQKQTTTPKTSTKKKTVADEALAIAQEEAEGKDFEKWVKESNEEDSGKKKALGAIARLMKKAGLNTRIISSKQIKENLGRNTESENIELSEERRKELIDEANQLNKTPKDANQDNTDDLLHNSLEEQESESYDGNDNIEFRLSKNNRAQITSWLNKRGDLSEEQKQAVLDHLDEMNNSKLQLATAWWFCKKSIRLGGEDDYKVADALKICEKRGLDFMKYNSPMEIIDEFGDVVSSEEKPIDPDTVSTLTNKRVLDNGITIYDVEESEEGRTDMRKIIDTHFGKNASPWCLLQGDGNGNLTEKSREYWYDRYNAYTKQVAFKDGKLIAFSANSNNKRIWWDRKDSPHSDIPAIGKIKGDELGRSGTCLYDPETGKLLRIENKHKGNKRNGVYQEWNENDQKIREVEYKNGKPNGTDRSWYSDGKLMREVEWDNGNINGIKRGWYPDGQLVYEGEWKDDKKIGIHREWYSNGQLRYEEELKDGRRNGLYREWYSNGVLRLVEKYKDGRRNGTERGWYENGQLRYEEEYKDDKLIGTTESWDESGQPMTELRNNNGVVLGYINHSTNTVYINEDEFDMATPIHEYTHAWARMMQEVDKDEWKAIVEALQTDKDTWEATKQKLGKGATKDAIASEMLSELSGVKGKEYFEAAKNEKDIVKTVKAEIKGNIKKVLGDFWDWVASNIFGVRMGGKKYDVDTVVNLPLRSFVNGVKLSKQGEVYRNRLDEAKDNLLKTLVENGITEGKTVEEKVSLYVNKWAEKNEAIIDATAKKQGIKTDEVKKRIKDTILTRMNIVSKMSPSSAGRSKGNIDSGFRKQVNSYLLGNGDVSRKGETNSYYEVNNRGDIKTVAQAANAALSDMVNGSIDSYGKPVDSKKKTVKLNDKVNKIIDWLVNNSVKNNNTGKEYKFTREELEGAFEYIKDINDKARYQGTKINRRNANEKLKEFDIDELFRFYDEMKINGTELTGQEETLQLVENYIKENKDNLKRPRKSEVAAFVSDPRTVVIKAYRDARFKEESKGKTDKEKEKLRNDIYKDVAIAVNRRFFEMSPNGDRLYSLSGETKIPQKQARIITKQLLKKLPDVRGSINRVEFYDATMPVDMISNMTAIQYGDYALGFVDKRTKTVYLNTRSMNVNTPFHEIGIHRLMAAAKTLGNEEFTNAILSFGRKAVEAAKYNTAMANMLNKFKSAYDFLDEGSDEFYEEFAANVLGHMNSAKLQKFIKDNSNVVKRAYNTISSFISDTFGKQYTYRSPLSSINRLGLQEMSDAIYDAIMDGKVLEYDVQSPEENRVECEKKKSVIEQLDEGVKTPAEWISEIKDKVSEYNKKNKNNKVDFGEVITWLSSFSPLAKISKDDISQQVNDRYYDSLPNIRNANRVLSKFGLKVTPIVRYLISAESVVESLERLIKKNGGEIDSNMEYSKTNTLVGSKVSAKVDEFRDTLMEKLNDICNKIIDNGRASNNPVSQENIDDYKRAKHAIERNRYIVSKQVWSGLKEEHKKSITETKVQQLYDAFKGSKSVSEVAGVYNIEEELVKAIFTKFADINNSKKGDNRSGYTTSEAMKIVTDFENIVGEKDVNALNDKFREASNAVIKELEDAGLISATMAEDFRGRYNFYVPLRGWDISEDRVAFFEDFDYLPKTKGNQAQAVTGAEGRTTRSASPFSSLEYIAMDAIAKGESNKSRQSIYRMALRNQDKASDLIYVQSDVNSIAAELGLLNSDGQVTVATTPKWVYDLYDKDREVRGRKGEGVVGSENESKHNRIEVYVDGKKYNIYVSGELGKQVAKAVNGTKNLSSMIASIVDNATRKTLKFAWDGMRNSTRFFSNLQTTYRFLSFFLPNFHRDALIPTQTFIEHGFKRAAKVWLGYIPSIIQVFKGDILNNPSEEYKEASRNGYAISYAKRESETDVLDRYNRRTRRLKKGKREESKANIANNKFVDIMSILEKAVRYSAYQAAKKDGASDDEAAYAAHTVSGNFSEKGTQTALSGVLSFYNPTVQSLLQQFRNWRDHSGRTAAAYMAHFTLGLISNIALRAMVDDDDEKKGLDSSVFGKDNPYNEMSENTKQTRLVIPTNVKDTYTDNAYGEVEGFTIHLPHNYRVLWYLSAKICDVASGADDIDTAAKDVANALLKEVNPVANLTYHSEDVPPIFVPSFLRPIVEAYSNTNYYGGNISRSDEARLDEYGNIVKGELPKGGTNEVLKRAGNELQFDAEKWEHILKSYLGDIWNIFDYATDVTMKSDAEQERYTISPFEKAIRTIYPENEALYSRVEELKDVAQIGADIQSRTKDYTDLERFGKYDEKTKNKITSQYDERFPIAAKELYDEYKQEITKLESIFALAVKDEKGDFGDKKYKSEKASNALKGIRRLNAEYGKAFQDLKEEHKKGKKQK